MEKWTCFWEMGWGVVPMIFWKEKKMKNTIYNIRLDKKLLLNFVFVLLSLLSFRAARSVVRLVFFDPVKNVNFYLLSFFHLVNFFHFSSIMPATPLMFCWGGNLLWTSVWQIFSLFCNIFCNNFSYVHVHKKI